MPKNFLSPRRGSDPSNLFDEDLAMIEIMKPTPREEYDGMQQIINIVFLMMLCVLAVLLVQLGGVGFLIYIGCVAVFLVILCLVARGKDGEQSK